MTTNGTKPALPEAPASATLKVTLRGYELLLTLRDHSGRELLAKVNAAIDALEAMGAQPAGTKPSVSVPNGSAPVCPTHGRPMRQSQHGGWFCPEKIADDDGTGKPVYCRQKVRA